MSTSFIRTKLKKYQLTMEDYEFYKNPFDYAFNFCAGEGKVKVCSAYDILPSKAQKLLKGFLGRYEVEQGSCHITASRVACLLQDYGVKLCDGYYQGHSGIKYHHSFCKIGDNYFDSTIETLYGFHGTKEFEYESIREFEPKEFKLYCIICAKLNGFPMDTTLFCSSLGENPYNHCDTKTNYMINNEGYLQEVNYYKEAA